MRPTLITFAFLLLLLAFACSKQDETIANEQKSIENFLQSNQINYTLQNGVYKNTFYSAADPAAPTIANGDSVYFYFGGYRFQGGLRNLFYTNIEALAEVANLDKTYLDFTPKGVKIGTTDLIPGLRNGMIGSHQGDSLMLFITSNLAYKDNEIGTLPKDSPLAFLVVIDKIAH